MDRTCSVTSDMIAALAKRIAETRELYGADSLYVVGLITGFDWLVEGSSDAEAAKNELRGVISNLESDTRKPTPSRDAAVPQTDDAGPLPENSWMQGTIKWFNNDKGYGFISTEGNVDVFVHWRDISSWDRSLGQGDRVEFMITKTAKGFQAINVMKGEFKTAEENGEGRAESDEPQDQKGAEDTSSVSEGLDETLEPTADSEASGGPSDDVNQDVKPAGEQAVEREQDTPAQIESRSGVSFDSNESQGEDDNSTDSPSQFI